MAQNEHKPTLTEGLQDAPMSVSGDWTWMSFGEVAKELHMIQVSVIRSAVDLLAKERRLCISCQRATPSWSSFPS
eukprot:1104937-Amphidinium_carterae.1